MLADRRLQEGYTGPAAATMTFKPAGIKALFNQHIFFVTTVELYLLASGPDVRRRAAGGCSASCRRQRHLRLSKGNMRLLRGRDPSPRLSAQYKFQMLVAVPCSAQNSNPIERSPARTLTQDGTAICAGCPRWTRPGAHLRGSLPLHRAPRCAGRGDLGSFSLVHTARVTGTHCRV